MEKWMSRLRKEYMVLCLYCFVFCIGAIFEDGTLMCENDISDGSGIYFSLSLFLVYPFLSLAYLILL
jgi:hypothetical protein